MNTRNADIEHRGNLGQVQLLDEMELHDQLQPLGELRDGFGERCPVIGFEQPRLGIGLGTVTKAYALLERRGLLRSVRGSGSFVAATEARKPVRSRSRHRPHTCPSTTGGVSKEK